MVELSPGQKLALDQLAEIAERSNGAFEILGELEEVADAAFVRVFLSIATGEYRTDVGFQFRERERLRLRVYPEFPFTRSELYFDHQRFAGLPHVQWGNSICLYQSPEAEYQPSDGLFGFFERVDVWLRAAGAGELDPDDGPLHPPVAYTSSDTCFVMKADTPPDDPNAAFWVGRADLTKVRDKRFDVIGWTHLNDWEDVDPDHPTAAAVILKQPLKTEYPTKVYDLIKLVETAGLDFGYLWRLLRLIALLTPAGEPARMVFGAPMRRKAAGEPLRPHLTVWEIAPEPLEALRAVVRSQEADAEAKAEAIKWLASAELKWCDVMEIRPEIVLRRDGGALASWLAGKRVLLLGCGALGSAVAEMIVRAGAATIRLVDNKAVKPGVLVRQRFSDADIGWAKSWALKRRLDGLGLQCAVSYQVHNLAGSVLASYDLAEWDIVIDATASVSVAHRLERELNEKELPVPLISMTISAAAQYGSVAVKMPGYRAGLHSIARQAKLSAFAGDAHHPAVRAFWPDPKDIKVFQPEPGCSAPTFIGSAADIDHHAAALLNLGLRRVQTLGADRASTDLIGAPWLKADARPGADLSYTFGGYELGVEKRRGYTVFRSKVAVRGIVEELRRIARRRSDKIETGGLLFGEIDDSHRRIWIDSVSGPPSDSRASAEQFLCGTAGTTALAAFKARESGRSSRFVGIWHTHPISRGSPSEDDLQAMIALLHLQDLTPRQVVMLIVGFSSISPAENYYLYRRNEFVRIPLGDADMGVDA